ncbi:hypothetical protein Pfo_012675 [Paulownia fortunei]|nr:hypothetical protein Pfo_012675 [Paulownia fortunei]
MGYYMNSKIVTICITLFFLLSLIISFARATPLLDDELQIKKTAPVFLNSRQSKNEKGNLYRNKLKRNRMKNIDARRFSAMLPKGYVPPSGSSRCHNVYRNSVTFFCDLSAEIREP